MALILIAASGFIIVAFLTFVSRVIMGYLFPNQHKNVYDTSYDTSYDIIVSYIAKLYNIMHEKFTRQKEFAALNEKVLILNKSNASIINENNNIKMKYKQLNIKHKQLKNQLYSTELMNTTLNGQILKLRKENDTIQTCYKAQIKYYTNNNRK
eukprot:148514_1